MKGEVFHISLFLIVCVLGLLRGHLPNFEEEGVYLEGCIAGDVVREDGRVLTRLKVERSELEGLEGRKVLLTVYGYLPGSAGCVGLIGDVRVKDNRVYVYVRAEDLEYKDRGKGLREFLVERYRKASDGEPVLRFGLSFLFGEPRDLLPGEVQGDFLRTGLVHLLVISGLHVGMIALLLSKMLPYFLGLKLALAGVLIYSFLIVPNEPPVLRATLMVTLIMLSHLTFRKPNHVNILLFSGTVILLVYPHYVYSYSFWLSFLATAYIILMLRDLEGGRVLKALAVSSSAFTGVAPLISTFSYISPMSVFFTPLIAPVVLLYSFFGMLSIMTLMSFQPFIDLFNLTGKAFVGAVSLASDMSFQIYPRIGTSEAILITLTGLVGLYILKGKARLGAVILVNGWLWVRALV